MAATNLIDRYLALPGELQSMILSFCTNNDLVCLSLANKNLHSLFATPKSAPLFTNEILASPGHLSLLPTSHPCYRYPWADYSARPFNGFYENLCRASECYHDEKLDCELWRRLRDWMPNNTRYCGGCRRFTKRDKRRRKGACKCTRPARRSTDNNWTYKKYRGFHRNFWKLHYTEANLAKVIRRYTEPRMNRSPYGLRERTKPSQKLLEHTSNHQYTQDSTGVWCKTDFT
ncbi:hypothetical protein VC83_07708 [Pseudogymnoascus destructans]|uniref:F-box domain-containing protein n=2 Tax=Pseudogymnoascus destructans TaxID=655981 RepID=L8FW78_PSED2|nr:uncharacterized protein VC83_07708 [Pseudogymnoascus destructans]ELR05205.1 hypothetical protein GMDG_01643 [Pseudogymnoascus destructans 20631-21]OAF55612.1 hypothetical protein VC83_07708 [Pseudogymnoascus destructans]